MARLPASLLDPRRRIHRIPEERNLPLEAANLAGNQEARVQAGTESGHLSVPALKVGCCGFQRVATSK